MRCIDMKLYTSGGGGVERGLYVPDSGSFRGRRYSFKSSTMCRDVACSPAIGAACDLFVHRGRKRLVGEASNAVCFGGVVGIGGNAVF